MLLVSNALFSVFSTKHNCKGCPLKDHLYRMSKYFQNFSVKPPAGGSRFQLKTFHSFRVTLSWKYNGYPFSSHILSPVINYILICENSIPSYIRSLGTLFLRSLPVPQEAQTLIMLLAIALQILAV